MNYRISQVQEAGFETFPRDYQEVLACAKKLKEIGKPMGMALGNAVGDGNGWTHHAVGLRRRHGRRGQPGGAEQPRNRQRARICQGALRDLRAGHAVVARSAQQQGVPVRRSQRHQQRHLDLLCGKDLGRPEAIQAVAEDMDHVNMPIGPVGEPTELHLFTQAMVFDYSPYPNAAKEYLRFMWEREQYEPWQQAAIGYITQPLAAYESNPIWTEDPKHTPFRDVVKNMRWNGYAGASAMPRRPRWPTTSWSTCSPKPQRASVRPRRRPSGPTPAPSATTASESHQWRRRRFPGAAPPRSPGLEPGIQGRSGTGSPVALDCRVKPGNERSWLAGWQPKPA
jgi:hypothetical protein